MYQQFKFVIALLSVILMLFLFVIFLKKKILFRFIFFHVLKSGIILTIINFIGIYFPKISIPISILSLIIAIFGDIPGITMLEIFKLIL